MKKLTKIRLINWHYLANETINVKDHVLLTGPNASGKSTIMDAVMYVITAGDTNFNMAANEKSKRDLRGYVKCKLGLDDKEYLREGDVTGHVALEFHDEKTNTDFTVGVVIDAFGELMPVKSLFYKVDTPLDDSWFVSSEGMIYSTVIFRKNHPDFEFYLTKKEAKKAFRNAFGSINEDFFKLIPKALAFKPISDVKEFIYQNVLEEKEIDVSAIKDTIRSYKELENTLNLIKKKISDLKEITNVYEELEKVIENKTYVEYLNILFEKERVANDIINLEKAIEQENLKKSSKESDLRKIEREIAALNQRSKELYNVLANDEVFKNNENIARDIEDKERNVSELEKDNAIFLKYVANFKDNVNEIRKRNKDRKIFNDLASMSLINLNNNEVDFTRLKLNEAKSLVEQYKQRNNQQLGALTIKKSEIIKNVNEIASALKKLSQNKVNFPSQLIGLRDEIEAGLKRIYNYDIPVFIFAELVEINDPNWADTIEVYLGNRRFNMIVEPRYYDQALQIFARIKDRHPIYGIGLVNTKKIKTFNSYEPNSLASIMSSENEDARRYINMTCGNVIMCDNELELEKYNTAITNDYLLYSQFTVRSLNPRIDKPFCGKNAYQSQLKVWEEKAAVAKTSYDEVIDEIDSLEAELTLLDNLDFQSILDGIESSRKLEYDKDALKGLYLQREHLKTSSLKDIEDDYNHILETITNNENKKSQITLEIGRVEQNILNLEEKIVEQNNLLRTKKDDLLKLGDTLITIKDKALNEYNEFMNGRSFSEAYKLFDAKYNVKDNTYDTLNEALMTKQYQYVNDYDSSFSIGITEMPSYYQELNKLEKTELIKYEQKVRTAREEAELIFKEDFIAKLRANIEQAEIEISKINDTLANIRFGNDTYEFVFPKSSEYGAFYEMVKSDIEGGQEGLFTTDFEHKYEEQIKELFDSLAVDEINSHGVINKFTDYRTYMDYDIKITNLEGESMSYSKVFKEKSGGETQVPFYVAIIASFVRIYTKTQAYGGDPIGIVMFDEVFDKMDSNRMKAMMDFITSMPLQTIIACPPQRMSLLQDYAKTILIMARQGVKAQVMPIIKQGGEDNGAI